VTPEPERLEHDAASAARRGNGARTGRDPGSVTKVSWGLIRALQDVAGVCDDWQETRWHEPPPPRRPAWIDPRRWPHSGRVVVQRFRYSERTPYRQLRSASFSIAGAAAIAGAVVLLVVLR
jgi:hypothetical protein